MWASMFKTRAQRQEEERIMAVSQDRLRQVGMERFKDELAKNVAYGNQRMLEIGRALASDPALLGSGRTQQRFEPQGDG